MAFCSTFQKFCRGAAKSTSLCRQFISITSFKNGRKEIHSLVSRCPHHNLLSHDLNPSRNVFSRLKNLQNSCRRTQRNFQTRKKKEIGESIRSEEGLLKPFCFTVTVCGVSFTAAMVWQYESMRSHAQKIIKGLEKHRDNFFGYTHEKNFGFRAHINSLWNNLSPGRKVIAGMIAANFAVFFLWKVTSLQPFLLRYFSSAPGTSLFSMVLSAFSHYNFLHLACNMYVFWSFSSVAINLFGKEQFTAVFFSAAAVSSFTSSIHKLLRGRAVPSLGASGALMAILGAVCLSYPDARLSIAFIGDIVPHSFSASSALKGIVLLDVVGLVLGWKLFDHAAHLGGMMFGLWYVTYGRDIIWGRRELIMKWWHDIRGKP